MTFKARLIASITIAATIVMAVFFYIAYVSLGITESRFSEEAVRGKGVLWQKVIKVQLDQMEVSTSSLTRARDVLKALRESKFNELTEAAAPTFNRLSSSNVITKLQIADNSGSIIYSQPHDFGGPTRKTLVRQAIDEQKVFRGIERDDDGQLTAEVAFPLYYRGKPVGVGIYMTSLDGALNDFKQADGSDLHIFSSDRELEITTDAEQFASIETRANDAGNAQHYTQNIDDQVISLVQMPLQDASGIAVANLVTATDYSESYARQSNVYIGGFSSGMLAFIACILFIYWYIGKAFKPMHQCLAVMEKISAGNLTETITVTTRDEFGQLMQGLQTMQTKLKSMINDINEATAQIESSAGNLEKVTLDSSESASNQQMITHQLSENIQQLIDASHEVSTSADDSSDASEQADTEVARGKSVIVDSVDTINLISQQINSAEAVVKQVHEGTETIGGVLDVIKGIAEQTNLLALNAAIEAARAGEQGRGFAVVADEVRTLASRTSESTSEIEAMIETLQKGASEAVEKMTGSIESVNKGVEIANLADESFNSIAQAVNSIRDKSRNIATASNHQMQLSQSMGEDIETISQSSEKAVAGNQSAVVSTEELTELAEKLKQKVSQFHT